MDVVEVVRRQYNGELYEVTIYECRQVMPWGTDPCSFRVAKWRKIESNQLELFTDAI